jgi:hypothetical protein
MTSVFEKNSFFPAQIAQDCDHNIEPSRSAGFGDKESLSYEDFKLMMKEFKGDFLAIGLDCKGAKQNYLDATTNVARSVSVLCDRCYDF